MLECRGPCSGQEPNPSTGYSITAGLDDMQGLAAHPNVPACRDARTGLSPARAFSIALTAVFMLTFFVGTAGAATIYKSVDDKGNVEYSQTPPRDRPSEAVEAGGSTSESSEQASGVEDEETAEPEEDKASDPSTDVKVVDREKARETCRQAREQREAVADDDKQMMVQDEEGKYRPMTEEQRSKRLERLDAIIEESCAAAEE